MGQLASAIENNTGRVQSGFPWFEADSNFATSGAMDPQHVGRDEIVMGGDSTAGVAYGRRYGNGGHIRILRYSGNAGTGNPAGGLLCQYHTNQVVQSSPAIGRFLRGGAIGIVAGTGAYFAGASDTNKLIAVDQSCHLRWKADLHGLTGSSPALANVLGNGGLQVIEGTRNANGSGRVYALNGATGGVYWSRALPSAVYGGITTADLTGRGYQDVIVPTIGGTYILDGKTGAVVGRIGVGLGFQNSALVTADSNGRIGITIAGYDSRNRGVVVHYRVDASDPSRVSLRGTWPMFHHDSRLSGNAGAGTPSSVPPQPASLPPPPRPASPPSSGRRLGSALPWASGVFASPETPAAAAAFGTWRGRPLNVVTTWSGRSTWQDIVDPSWLYQRWTGSPYTMVFGVAMLPERVSGVSLQKCASGSYNSYWRQFGQVISSYHLGTSIIRLGWEFNGDWYVWAATSPATWVSCWRNIVTSTRATAPGLKWDWNVNRGVSAGLADPTRAYPGNSYVNIVGVDSYDNWPPATTPAGWQTQLNGTQGLDYWLAFAKAHDKPLSVPEWGNVCGTSSGGDDPQYVRYMRAFFAANAARLAYEANFQSPTTCGTYAPGTTVPNSAAAYKAGFGG
jgi:hypothetical protein